MRLFGYPYNDLVICKDSPDYLSLNIVQESDSNDTAYNPTYVSEAQSWSQTVLRNNFSAKIILTQNRNGIYNHTY